MLVLYDDGHAPCLSGPDLDAVYWDHAGVRTHPGENVASVSCLHPAHSRQESGALVFDTFFMSAALCLTGH